MKNRKGIIKIDLEFFKEEDNLLVLKDVFSNLVPVFITEDFVPVFITEDFEHKTYHCLSLRFDEVKEGEEVPIYDVQVEKSVDIMSNKDYCINFKRLI